MENFYFVATHVCPADLNPIEFDYDSEAGKKNFPKGSAEAEDGESWLDGEAFSADPKRPFRLNIESIEEPAYFPLIDVSTVWVMKAELHAALTQLGVKSYKAYPAELIHGGKPYTEVKYVAFKMIVKQEPPETVEKPGRDLFFLDEDMDELVIHESLVPTFKALGPKQEEFLSLVGDADSEGTDEE